jgi:hypothetical protein
MKMLLSLACAALLFAFAAALDAAARKAGPPGAQMPAGAAGRQNLPRAGTKADEGEAAKPEMAHQAPEPRVPQRRRRARAGP